MKEINALPKVRRVVVVNELGSMIDCYTAKNVEVQIQDDGKTLKIFYDAATTEETR